MPISGLLITLVEDRALARGALTAIDNEPQCEMGPKQGLRVPVVLETPNPVADKQSWKRLTGLPGVRHVDVVFIHFDHATESNQTERHPATHTFTAPRNHRPTAKEN